MEVVLAKQRKSGLEESPQRDGRDEALVKALYRFVFKMETEASRGLGYAGVPGGTSSKNRLKGNEGMHLKANRYRY